MRKITNIVLAIVILLSFTSCSRKSPEQAIDNITPTSEITQTAAVSDVSTGNMKINVSDIPEAQITESAGSEQDLYRTAQENREYYDKVESEKSRFYSIETPDYIYYYDAFFCDLIYAADKKVGRTLYFLNGDCIFIMIDGEIGPTYEETIKAGEPVYLGFEDIVYDLEVEPFDGKAAEALPDQVDKILAGEQIKLPANYYLLDYCEGDLNLDGLKDIAVVIEQAPGMYTGSRAVCILLQKNGAYLPTFENASIILGRDEGGVYGDPYGGIIIENGEFHVYDCGGSDYRWSHDYSFKYRENQLILSDIEETNCYLDTMYGTSDHYDFIKGTRETRSYYEGDADDASAENPYNNLLLYSGKIINSGITNFKDAYAWCNYDLQTDPVYIRPDPGKYEYGQKDYQSAMKYSPEEMLDIVRNEYFPYMKKVNLRISKEISDNYQPLIGYRLPVYYYTDGNYILCYNSFETPDGERYLHQLRFYSVSDRFDDEYYEFWDDTGERVTSE